MQPQTSKRQSEKLYFVGCSCFVLSHDGATILQESKYRTNADRYPWLNLDLKCWEQTLLITSSEPWSHHRTHESHDFRHINQVLFKHHTFGSETWTDVT